MMESNKRFPLKYKACSVGAPILAPQRHMLSIFVQFTLLQPLMKASARIEQKLQFCCSLQVCMFFPGTTLPMCQCDNAMNAA